MLNTNIIIVAAGLTLILVFIIYKNFSKRKKISNTNIVDNNLDESMQTTGINNKNPEEKKMTLQERIELSWEFLYKITEIIINKFSKEDTEILNKCGHILLQNGGKYEHVVSMAVKQTKSRAQSAEQSQAKGQKTLGK